MSLQIELKKSAVSQKLPFPSDLALGEIALNYNADGPFLTCKDTAGNIRKLNLVWVGATAPSSPTAGDPWLDTSGSTALLRIYDGSTWTVAVNVPLATTSAYGTVRLATSADITNGTAGKIVDAAQLSSKVSSDISTALAASPLFLNSIETSGNATINGNLTVNGTTTTIDTTNLSVEDRNIEIGVVDTPSDTTANTGGITLKGATDKTIRWLDATDSWTSSEHVDLASGKSYRINGTEVLSATALGSAVQISSANIPNGTIVDSDINAAAEIAVSKLADGAARQLLQTDAAGTGVEWTSNVDVPGTLDVTSTATFDSIASHPLGSAAAPTLTFTGDTNTGIYSPGTDQVAISSNSSERIRIGANGEIGIAGANYGTSGQVLTSGGSGAAPSWQTPAAANTDKIEEGNSSAEVIDTGSDGRFVVTTEGSERARIDSSGRLLVGTSSARTNLYGVSYAPIVQIETAGAVTQRTLNLAFNNNGTTASGPILSFTTSRGSSVGSNTLVANNDELGALSFAGTDGTKPVTGANIIAYVDGTPGTNDMPGRLVFSTTADGASLPTEQLRITSDRYVRLASGSGGIQFNGDTAAANALDDYEEGTWTPSFSGGTGSPNNMCRWGHYVKVGRVVTVTLASTSACGGAGATFTQITGLPFTAGGISGESKMQQASFYQRDNDNSTLTNPVIQANAGIFQDQSTLQMGTTVTIQSTKSYNLTITYITTS